MADRYRGRVSDDESREVAGHVDEVDAVSFIDEVDAVSSTDEVDEALATDAENTDLEISDPEISDSEISDSEISDREITDLQEPVTDDEVLDDAVDEPAAPGGGPSGWRAPEPTGVQAVDDALAPLLELDYLPTAEHVPYYEAAHRQLQDALADLDGS